jgi:hypothetical protein
VWAYAASPRDEPLPLPRVDPRASADAAAALLERIFSAKSRIEVPGAAGVSDLLANVALKLRTAQGIDRENGQILLRLAGRAPREPPKTDREGVSTTTRGRR